MKRRPLVTILIGAVVVLCLCAALGALVSPSKPTTPASAPATASPAATSAPAGYITKDTVDFAWPFTIAAGRMACLNGNHIVFITDDGTTYAVNGLARGAIKNGAAYKDFEEIWMDNPKSAGTKIPAAPVIEIGQKLCE